jgi:hypothetical protein
MKRINKRILLASLFIAVGVRAGYAQNNFNIPHNSNNRGLIQIAGPSQLADTLNLWGDVNRAGKYLVPRGTSLTDLLSYAHGPTLSVGSHRRKVKKIIINVSRFNNASNTYQSKTFDFKMGKSLPAALKNYNLQDGDVVTVKTKGRPRFRQFVTIVSSILSLGLTVYLAASR